MFRTLQFLHNVLRIFVYNHKQNIFENEAWIPLMYKFLQNVISTDQNNDFLHHRPLLSCCQYSVLYHLSALKELIISSYTTIAGCPPTKSHKVGYFLKAPITTPVLFPNMGTFFHSFETLLSVSDTVLNL